MTSCPCSPLTASHDVQAPAGNFSAKAKLPVAVVLQVTPTVGVHADDASGKKAANMQKHFRHLVNETASKQRFLRSLHRTNSAKEGSGSLPSLKQEPTANGNLAVKEEPMDSIYGEGQQTAVHSSQAVALKTEPMVKAEPGFAQAGFAEPADAHGQLDPDLAASAGLPESLGEELGDAACLKADPDSLMEDALHPSGPTSATPAPSDNQAVHAVKQEQGQSGCHQPTANHNQAVLNKFMNILGGAVDADTAQVFIAQAGGLLDAAINSYYDNAAVTEATAVNSTEQASGPVQASSSETSAKSLSHSLTQSATEAGAVSVSKKRPSRQQSGQPTSKGKKRGGAAQTITADIANKKQKSSSTAQRSIATFFGSGQTGSRKNSAQVEKEAAGQQRHSTQAGQMPDDDKVSARAIPQHGIKLEDVVDLCEDIASMPDQADSLKSINPADDAMETEAVLSGGAKATTSIRKETTPLASDGSTPLPFDHGAVKPEQQHNPLDDRQPVHPFFVKGRQKPDESAPVPAVKGDTVGASPAQGKGKTQSSADQPAGKGDAPEGKGVDSNREEGVSEGKEGVSEGKEGVSEGKAGQLEGKPARVNPFQKTKAEPEKDVPVDAVLLPTTEYDPVKMAVWEAGQATPYRHISRAFQAIESTTKRLRIGDAIANMFRSILALSPGMKICRLQLLPFSGQML